jgi:hypothetical protein
MIIKFSCSKHCLDFEKTEEQLRTERAITHCPFCGEKLHIQNLNDVVASDMNKQVKEYIDKWFKELGIEGTIELVERNKDQAACYRLYKEELEKRGFKVK